MARKTTPARTAGSANSPVNNQQAERPTARFVRRGKVRVIRTVAEPEKWTTASGSVLTASPGDLMLTDGTHEWSIDPTEFERTYRRIGDACFERIGEVQARPAVPGEVVASAEGTEVAVPGDWLVCNDAGYAWLVSSAHFEQAYCSPRKPSSPSEGQGSPPQNGLAQH